MLPFLPIFSLVPLLPRPKTTSQSSISFNNQVLPGCQNRRALSKVLESHSCSACHNLAMGLTRTPRRSSLPFWRLTASILAHPQFALRISWQLMVPVWFSRSPDMQPSWIWNSASGFAFIADFSSSSRTQAWLCLSYWHPRSVAFYSSITNWSQESNATQNIPNPLSVDSIAANCYCPFNFCHLSFHCQILPANIIICIPVGSGRIVTLEAAA